MSGTLIAVCGIDGGGKTSQVELLSTRLKEDGFKVKVVKFVDRSSQFFQNLENIISKIPLQTYCELVAFERYQRAKDILPNELNNNDVVICDRYVFTDLAYPYAYKCNLKFLKGLIDEFPMPDITLLFDIPASEAIHRIKKRGDIWTFQEREEILGEARDEYLRLLSKYSFILIDAKRSIEEISNDVYKIVITNIREGNIKHE